MINTVVGKKEDLVSNNLSINLSNLNFISPENFSHINSVDEIVIFNISQLSDKDIPVLNNSPFLLIISTELDLIHLKMHLSDKRLVLTPFDFIHIDERLISFEKNLNWIKPFLINLENIEKILSLHNLSNSKYALKDEFASLSKSVWISLNYKMRELYFFPYDPVVAAPKSLQKTLSVLFPLTDIVDNNLLGLPPDLLVLDKFSIKSYLEKYKEVTGLLYLSFINSKNTIEYIYQEISSFFHVPINLNELKLIGPLGESNLLAVFIIEINR